MYYYRFLSRSISLSLSLLSLSRSLSRVVVHRARAAVGGLPVVRAVKIKTGAFADKVGDDVRHRIRALADKASGRNG